MARMSPHVRNWMNAKLTTPGATPILNTPYTTMPTPGTPPISTPSGGGVFTTLPKVEAPPTLSGGGGGGDSGGGGNMGSTYTTLPKIESPPVPDTGSNALPKMPDPVPYTGGIQTPTEQYGNKI